MLTITERIFLSSESLGKTMTRRVISCFLNAVSREGHKFLGKLNQHSGIDVNPVYLENNGKYLKWGLVRDL